MTTDHPTHRSKPITRRTVAALRDAMTPEARTEGAAAIARAVDAVLADRPGPAGTLALYAAKGTEVDTLAIDRAARARGYRIAYPRVVAGERALAFHFARPDQLVTGKFGIRQPHADAPPCSAIDIFVVPGLAFDRAGGRLGWGQGYYDASLQASALKIGVAFECQLVDTVPLDPHDIPLEMIITELGIVATTTAHVVTPEVTP